MNQPHKHSATPPGRTNKWAKLWATTTHLWMQMVWPTLVAWLQDPSSMTHTTSRISSRSVAHLPWTVQTMFKLMRTILPGRRILNINIRIRRARGRTRSGRMSKISTLLFGWGRLDCLILGNCTDKLIKIWSLGITHLLSTIRMMCRALAELRPSFYLQQMA